MFAMQPWPTDGMDNFDHMSYTRFYDHLYAGPTWSVAPHGAFVEQSSETFYPPSDSSHYPSSPENSQLYSIPRSPKSPMPLHNTRCHSVEQADVQFWRGSHYSELQKSTPELINPDLYRPGIQPPTGLSNVVDGLSAQAILQEHGVPAPAHDVDEPLGPHGEVHSTIRGSQYILPPFTVPMHTVDLYSRSHDHEAPPHSQNSTEPAIDPAPGDTITPRFPCPLAPYGCRTSFGNKKTWKRHLLMRHLKFDIWRCDRCKKGEGVDERFEFSRKDLYVQHLRRLHSKKPRNKPDRKPGRGPGQDRGHDDPSSSSGCDDTDTDQGEATTLTTVEINTAAKRCHKKLRTPPEQSSCIFCNSTFHGRGSWSECIEHIGQHFVDFQRRGRAAPPLEDWRIDLVFHAWLKREHIITRVGGTWRLTKP
ncbi:hypothetical protein K461DRAFT_280339 [Myriangium duriaei CBS 260.36]|uniref:C2H2-type domain-containing protein n=1 Tax=Myriangium duriaei CBS 260.36 TaxID=1168546 RepID=A0A9P4IZ18_9PEZI|nr:hypothetical protein K461DRAFT_280339 [Myriangium duriaei CBS 260.36]